MTGSGAGDLLLGDFRPVSSARVAVNLVDRPALAVVDAHNHLGRWLTEGGGWMAPDVGQLLETMDACDVLSIINLDGRWGSELDENLERYDLAHPGRFHTFAHLDWRVLARDGDPSAALVAQVEAAADQGAKGLKVWKDLGLTVRDGTDELVMPDDPRLHDAFVRAGELGLPVLIHTADPLAFFQPLDENNERIEELAKHPDWWFGGPGLPGFDELLGSMAHLIESCPGTQFVGAHVGGAAEDLSLVARLLDRLPNLSVDLGGRMAELGRQPRAAAKLISQYCDRVLFGTDAFPVGPEDYRHWYRFLETDDECFDYAPEAEIPPQGRWQVSALNLPADVLPKLYSGNANRLLRTPAH